MTLIFLILFMLGVVTCEDQVTEQVIEQNQELIDDFIVTGDVDIL